MKSLSLKTKTFFMSGIIITLLCVVGGVGYYAVNHLNKSIYTLSEQSLPAVRNMTLVDMMHDGIRAVVYRSMVAKPEEHQEIRDELKEFSNNISTYLASIEKLGLDEKLNADINQAGTTIKEYQSNAEKVVNASLSGDKAKAEEYLVPFKVSFEKLEEDLGKIGDNIETTASAQSQKSQNEAAEFSKMTLYIVCFGIIVSALISYLAYAFISGLTTGLLKITKGLKSEAETIVDTAQSMSEVSSRLSEASVQQAASLQETVSSIDEISAMVTRNADSATTSASMSNKTTHMAHKGKEKADQMLNSINQISDGNQEIIVQINKSNSEISEIVKVIENISLKTQIINDIVFQTKLLSFNASVEAARAGEHGKGFSVVAEEIGSLASMSGTAANEITEMLAGSVRKVTDIVENTKNVMEGLIRKSKEKVEFGTVTGKECANALDEILGNISTVNEMVSEIATASREQSAGVTEVNKAMTELDHVTQSNSGIAQESAQAASGLENQAIRLNQLVQELTAIVGGKSDSQIDIPSTNAMKIKLKEA